MYQENGFSTPVKWRVDNPYTPGAPIKLYEGSLLQTTLDDFRQQLFPGFSDSLRKKIEKNKLKAVKSSECTWAPMKSGTKRKTTQRDLKSTKQKII
jgi:hypothetical protein